MLKYANHLVANQSEQAHSDQVKNNAGGYTFKLDCFDQLRRFLILGSEGGTYYVAERKLTRDNIGCLQECIKESPQKTVDLIVEISTGGHAPKNDPAIFALAMVASDSSPTVRSLALAALPKVCRIGTHLFHFVSYLKQQRGWSSGLRKAIAKWYLTPSIDKVALQSIKYKQRDGYSHRDLLRLSHAEADSKEREALFRWIVSGKVGLAERILMNTKTQIIRVYSALNEADLPPIIQGFELCKKATNPKEVAKLIQQYQLPQECVGNEFKNEPVVWEALLPHMGLTAILRNLGKLSSIGVLKPLSDTLRIVQSSLLDPVRLKQEQIHPLSLLMAHKIYSQGHGEKGSLSWSPNANIQNALNQAFYLSFKNIEPTGQKYLLGLDVSGSMASSIISNMYLTAREASAAMAMVTAKTEQNWHVCGFTGGFIPLNIHPLMSLDQIVSCVSNFQFDRTDCAMPMLYAMKNKIEVDTFVIYTDNETWSGSIHPHVALEQYRQLMGRPAKLAVVGMTATEFTIAHPNDPGMIDVVGFDTSTPSIIADFSRNPIDKIG